MSHTYLKFAQYYFLQLQLTSLVILLWLFIKLLRNKYRSTENLIFLGCIASTFIIIFMDTIYSFLDGLPGQEMFIINNILNAFYLSLSGFIALLWLSFVVVSCYPEVVLSRLVQIIAIIPALFLAICCILSPKFAIIFYMDKATNTYQHGNYYIIWQLVVYAYFTLAAIIALIACITQKAQNLRTKNTIICSFIIFPLAAGIITHILSGIVVTWVAITIAFLFVYTELRFTQITTDPLTGINNSIQAEKYINNITSYPSDDTRIFIIFKLDELSAINKKYGHLEGDKALKALSKILIKTLAVEDSFIARYSINEFICTTKVNDHYDSDTIKENLLKNFHEYNEQKLQHYELKVKIGSTALNPGDNLNILIKRAREMQK